MRSRTYRQLWQNGQRVARMLKRRGMQRGERFALLMFNHPEFVDAMIGAAIAGVVFVPLDPRVRGAKLAYMLSDSGCRGAICGPYALEGLVEAAAQGLQIEWVYVLGGAVPATAHETPFEVDAFDTVLAAAAPSPALAVAVTDLREPMQVMYTSGTTGDPKGIVVPHARFANVANHGESVFGYRHTDRPYTGLSLTHGNAQFVTLAPSLKMGLRAVISRKFSKSRLWDIVRKHRCTTFSLLGGMPLRSSASPGAATMRTIRCGS